MLELHDCEEYDALADYCAKNKLTGDYGTKLPDGISPSVLAAINEDVDSFMQRVRQFAYSRAMGEVHTFFSKN